MLHVNKGDLVSGASVPLAINPVADGVQFYGILTRFLRRQWPVVALVAAASLALGIAYIISVPPSYTAQATMMIDTRKVNLFQQQSIMGDAQVDSANVESQVEILRSENIALAVIRQLKLASDPEFAGPGDGIFGIIASALGDLIGTAPRSDFQNLRKAAETFSQRLSVRRVGLTYVIEIRFRSLDAGRAAQIANAVADSYIVDQLDAKYQATQRASVWLQDRMRELRDQASTAERAVVDYKTRNNIVDAGGRLMSDQQLGELNTQLVSTRGATAEAKARLDRVQSIISSGVPNATVADSLRNEVVNKLRQQYLELQRREADWSSRYGYNHLAAVNLRNQMNEMRQSLLDELRRIAETYKSDYEIARQREEAIQKSVAAAVTSSQATSEAQVALRELESSAQSYRTLYDNFLQRYMESVQQQTFPITEARLITAATPPLEKSSPRVTLTLILCGLGGTLAGLGLARLKDVSDRAFRSGAQVEAVLRTNCLAVLPTLGKATGSLAPLPNADAIDAQGGRIVSHAAPLMWEVSRAPFGRYAESLRAVKVAADLNAPGKASKIVAVTSTLPNEGKSTIAASLAQVIAQGGSRVLLVDADLRNPSTTAKLAPSAGLGLLELVGEKIALADVIWRDPVTGFDFLPLVVSRPILWSSEFFNDAATTALFESLRRHYDYIILDLPPLAPIVDVRTTSHLVDSYVFVVEWGRTEREAVQRVLADSPQILAHTIGVVLNKANLRTIGRYDAYNGGGYYNKYYGKYLS